MADHHTPVHTQAMAGRPVWQAIFTMSQHQPRICILLLGLKSTDTLEAKYNTFGAQRNSAVVKVLAFCMPGSHMDAGSNPGQPASHPAPCLWPGKAVKDGPNPWNLAPVGDLEEAPGSWLQIWLSSSCCAHLGSQQSIGRSSSLSSSLYI